MRLPVAETETFNVVNSTPIYPEELKDHPDSLYVRGDPDTTNLLDSDQGPSIYEFYGSARRMQNVSFEVDMSYPGEDQMIGTLDDGRSRMLAYEEIPFRIEQGEIPFILGDNFSFDAVLENEWNLATSKGLMMILLLSLLRRRMNFQKGKMMLLSR